MHELSLCRSIYTIAARAAAGRAVVRITLDVGALRQVVVPTLEYCWTLVRQETALEGAELAVNQIPALVRCQSCAREWTPVNQPAGGTPTGFVCPACGPGPVSVLSGEEFLVRSIDVGD
jgi:hydrogenase nickel incorporation protein HypA/HybF